MSIAVHVYAYQPFYVSVVELHGNMRSVVGDNTRRVELCVLWIEVPFMEYGGPMHLIHAPTRAHMHTHTHTQMVYVPCAQYTHVAPDS